MVKLRIRFKLPAKLKPDAPAVVKTTSAACPTFTFTDPVWVKPAALEILPFKLTVSPEILFKNTGPELFILTVPKVIDEVPPRVLKVKPAAVFKSINAAERSMVPKTALEPLLIVNEPALKIVPSA